MVGDDAEHCLDNVDRSRRVRFPVPGATMHPPGRAESSFSEPARQARSVRAYLCCPSLGYSGPGYGRMFVNHAVASKRDRLGR